MRAAGLVFGKARVPLAQPRRARQEDLGLPDARAFGQLRLVESREEVNQREAEDAQRGRDAHAVEEPTQLRAWMMVEAVVKSCHPSVIRERCGAISECSAHIPSYVTETTPTTPGHFNCSTFMPRVPSAPTTPAQKLPSSNIELLIIELIIEL